MIINRVVNSILDKLNVIGQEISNTSIAQNVAEYAKNYTGEFYGHAKDQVGPLKDKVVQCVQPSGEYIEMGAKAIWRGACSMAKWSADVSKSEVIQPAIESIKSFAAEATNSIGNGCKYAASKALEGIGDAGEFLADKTFQLTKKSAVFVGGKSISVLGKVMQSVGSVFEKAGDRSTVYIEEKMESLPSKEETFTVIENQAKITLGKSKQITSNLCTGLEVMSIKDKILTLGIAGFGVMTAYLGFKQTVKAKTLKGKAISFMVALSGAALTIAELYSLSNGGKCVQTKMQYPQIDGDYDNVKFAQDCNLQV